MAEAGAVSGRDAPMGGPVGAPVAAPAGGLETALDGIGITAAHRTILILVIAGALFDSFEQNTIGLVAPLLRQQWGLAATAIGLLNTITFASGAVGRLASGWIGDRWGRRTMLLVNLLLFTLGAMFCALAPNFGVLAAGRAIVGFGLGGELAIAVTMVAEFCSARSRGAAVGLVNLGAGGLGNFLAPAFALLIFAIFPGPDRWRWLFAALVAPALLALAYRPLIPETPRFLLSRGRVAAANAVLARLAAGRLGGAAPAQRSFVTGQEGVVLDHATGGGAAIFTGPYLRRTLGLGIAIWMSYGAQITVLTLLPTILVARGYTITSSLLFTMVVQSGSFFGAGAGALFAYHLPRRLVLTVGAVLACVAALGLGFLALPGAAVLLLAAVFQFFVLLLNTTLWVHAPEVYPTRMRAFGTGFILATGTAAGAFMPLLSGRLFDLHGMAGVFGLIAVMYAIFAVSVRIVPETFGKPMDGPVVEVAV
jgi:putative MFS transporter